MERASELIAKIIDRGAFHSNPLIDMTVRKDSALRRAWKILASAQLVDAEAHRKLVNKHDELTDKLTALQLEYDNATRDAARECEELEKKLDDKTDECIELQKEVEALREEIADLKTG